MLLGIKRIYEKASITDGRRILVDRLWPRGVRRSTANIDSWIRDVAPSKELRSWFLHDTTKWVQFEKKYRKELEANEYVRVLMNKSKRDDVTLVYSSNDKRHNNAVVLLKFLREKLREDHKQELKLLKEKQRLKLQRQKQKNIKLNLTYS